MIAANNFKNVIAAVMLKLGKQITNSVIGSITPMAVVNRNALVDIAGIPNIRSYMIRRVFHRMRHHAARI